MRKRDFLREKIICFVLSAIFIVVLWMMGYAFGVPVSYKIALTVLFFLGILSALIWEYYQKSRFYNDFADKLNSLDQKYLITETVKTPDFFEGRFICECLYEIDKSMKDRISELEISQEEFKDYVEMWVHEIKIPVQNLSLMNYAMQKADAVRENEAEEIRRQRIQIQRLSYYIEQILFLVRADYSEKDYLLKPAALESVVNEVVKSNKELLIGNHISIEKKNLDVDVITDGKWLAFMVGQIVSNSIKYIKQDNGSICFEAAEEKDKVIFSITDNGIGVSRQDLPRVFDKTFTGENGRTDRSSTGMGLYICKKLCDKMGHRISMESVQGEYTKVLIEFGKNDFYLTDL